MPHDAHLNGSVVDYFIARKKEEDGLQICLVSFGATSGGCSGDTTTSCRPTPFMELKTRGGELGPGGI